MKKENERMNESGLAKKRWTPGREERSSDQRGSGSTGKLVSKSRWGMEQLRIRGRRTEWGWRGEGEGRSATRSHPFLSFPFFGFLNLSFFSFKSCFQPFCLSSLFPLLFLESVRVC
ncbi:hypothetical protein IE53DRAFT_382876 [Violaceomyces palustris]|uniref:Uncharacterized protein n=1 Tax=Violaceomyces palustris TaxID=1673888 RepID=A0ACD0NKY6_9BASI|nr:hypothetical protein IE53DRAFT_382876 [Violaceomyces palustris]